MASAAATRVPPNIDEFANLIRLGRALRGLAEPADVQRSRNPEGEAARTLAAAFTDVWPDVRRVFGPALPSGAGEALEAIARAFDAPRSDPRFRDAALDADPHWRAVRAHARSAIDLLPRARPN